MGIRHLKIIFVVIIALICLAYATQNVVNLDAAYQSFVYVMGGADHAVYKASFMPAISSPALIWPVLILVVGCEFLAGLLAAKGALAMWSARNDSAAEFNWSKKYALLGSGLGIIIWMGFFGAFGGAFFQMWQTTVGALSLEGAFQYSVSCAIVFIIVNMDDA